MPFHTGFPEFIAREGVRVEYLPGWETRGSSAFNPGGVVCHWTAGPRNTSSRPSLNVVAYGRPGIPGPLAQVYLDRDGIAVIVAAGRANHAGEGGYRGLVGNSSVFGIEAESAGNGDWTQAQRVAYPRLVAGLLRYMGRGADWTCGHNEWAPSRKIDIHDWPMATMRSQVVDILAGNSEEDDMFTEQDRANATELRRILGVIAGGTPPATPAEKVLVDRLASLDRILDNSADNRRMLGVLFGWQPAQGPEVDALVKLYNGEVPDVDVDEKALAAALAPLVLDNIKSLSDDEVARIARAAADETDRRSLERLTDK